MRSGAGALIVYALAALACGGCESFASKATYSKLIDQVYYTRGASEAALGAYGIEDNTGIDAFEREGPGVAIPDDQITIRSFMTVYTRIDDSANLAGGVELEVARITGDASASNQRTRKMALLVVDVHKDWLVNAINNDAALLAKLREDPNYRVITAIATLSEYDDQGTARTELKLTGKDQADIARGELTLKDLTQTNVTLSAGTVYAYQFSIPCFDSAGKLRYLKTDRPGVGDRLPMNTIDATGRDREPGVF